MSEQIDEQTLIDILAAHADQLNAGLLQSIALLSVSAAQLAALRPLLQLAERISQALTPVEPSPVFIASLELELGREIHRPAQSLFTRYRKTTLVALATLGSAASVSGVVLLYLLRLRANPGAPRLTLPKWTRV